MGSAILEKDDPEKSSSQYHLWNLFFKIIPLSQRNEINLTLKQQLHSIEQNISGRKEEEGGGGVEEGGRG